MNKKTTYEYYRPDWQEESDIDTFESAHDGSDEWDYKWTVEDICDDRFSDWDYSCPEVLMIRKQGETEWRKYECEVETVPQFSAWQAKR